MQSKLATWSSEDKGRKFDRLLRMIANRSWLQEAARVTLASRGAHTPGIDGVDKGVMEFDMDKTHMTHVNDGFTFLGHRIIRKRGSKGTMRPITTIPRDKFRNFAHKLVKELSGNYSENKIEQVESLNRKLAAWANFYQFTDYTAVMYGKLDRIIFWKLAHWLARKYRTAIKKLVRRWVRHTPNGKALTWLLFGKSGKGNLCGVALRRLVTSRKCQFRWRNPEINPYIHRENERNTVTSRYRDVAMAMSHA